MVSPIPDHHMHYSAAIKKTDRKFLPEDFAIRDWDSLQPYFENLANRGLIQFAGFRKMVGRYERTGGGHQ